MSSDIWTLPMMVGMPALVIEAQDFLIAPGHDTREHISVGAATVGDEGPALFVGLYTRDRHFISGVIPAAMIGTFKKLIEEAEQEIANGCPNQGGQA